MNRLILQWTEFVRSPFIPLERIVSLAARHRFGVMVGLSHCSTTGRRRCPGGDPAGFLGAAQVRWHRAGKCRWLRISRVG
jgi:hypothetical protein